jgi:hypothetical protein
MRLYDVVVTTISEYTVLAESQEQAEDVIHRWVDDGRSRTVPGLVTYDELETISDIGERVDIAVSEASGEPSAAQV